jgi:hypothetical protein
MRLILVAAGLLLGCASVALADSPSAGTSAFETAYAASFYQFDGCGDGIAGRSYRRALSDKVAHCPFPADIKARFVRRAAAQRRKSAALLTKMIEDHGGLPIRLDGMTRTCREQAESPEYRAIRARLDDFAAGKAGVDTVVPVPCDAAEIYP